MSEPVIRVTVEDLLTGEVGVREVGAADYVLICTEPCRLTEQQHHANGTARLVLKGRRGL